MTAMVNDFNASHPGIRVEPVFASNYVETMAKAMTAVLGGPRPTWPRRERASLRRA